MQKKLADFSSTTSFHPRYLNSDWRLPDYPRAKLVSDFLGYDPTPPCTSRKDCLRAAYRRLGIARRQAARILGIDQTTLIRHELEEDAPSPMTVKLVEALVAAKTIEDLVAAVSTIRKRCRRKA